MVSNPSVWEASLQACYDHRLRLHNVWRAAVGAATEDVIESVQQSLADQRLFSMASRLSSIIGSSIREDLGKDKEVLRLCGSEVAHIWTMVSRLLQSELEEGLGPLIMVKYLEFSLSLSRVEIAFAEVMVGYVSLCKDVNLTFVVSMLGGSFRMLSNLVIFTRSILTAVEYLRRQVNDDGVEETQDDTEAGFNHDYLSPFLHQMRSLMLEAIASCCELLEGILQYHYDLPTLEGLIHEIINVRLNCRTSTHAQAFTHEELELWLDATKALGEGRRYHGFRAAAAPSRELLAEMKPTALDLYLMGSSKKES